MTKIFFLLPHARYSAATTQTIQLCSDLMKTGNQVAVATLRGGAAEAKLAAVNFERIGQHPNCSTAAGALTPLQIRRRISSFQPDLIHVWGMQSLRVLVAAQGRRTTPIVLSQPLTHHKRGYVMSWWDRMLAKRAQRVILASDNEKAWCTHFRIDPAIIHFVPPGVGRPAQPACDILPRKENQIPFTIACVGPFDPIKHYYTAIWAVDVLLCLEPSIRLIMVGEGSDLPRLRYFRDRARLQNHVTFVDRPADVTDSILQADIVWIPTNVDRGRNVALEALALGRPVVASDLPGLKDIIQDGETGMLFPAGDKAALCRTTRILIENPHLRRRIGRAGLASVEMQFPLERFCRAHRDIYNKLAA